MADAVARRGDIAVIVQQHRDLGSAERTSVTLGLVTSITREGIVAAVDSPFCTDSEPQSVRLRADYTRSILVVGQDAVDVQAAMQAYRAHVYEGHKQIQPFDSLDALKGFLRTYRVAAAKSAS